MFEREFVPQAVTDGDGVVEILLLELRDGDGEPVVDALADGDRDPDPVCEIVDDVLREGTSETEPPAMDVVREGDGDTEVGLDTLNVADSEVTSEKDV